MYTWRDSDGTLWKAVSTRPWIIVYFCFCYLRVLDGLSKLFKEIKDKEKIEDLSIEYQKFAEWLRIE